MRTTHLRLKSKKAGVGRHRMAVRSMMCTSPGSNSLMPPAIVAMSI